MSSIGPPIGDAHQTIGIHTNGYYAYAKLAYAGVSLWHQCPGYDWELGLITQSRVSLFARTRFRFAANGLKQSRPKWRDMLRQAFAPTQPVPNRDKPYSLALETKTSPITSKGERIVSAPGPYVFPEMFRGFSFMPRFNDHISDLANLAEPENWEYQNIDSHEPKPILCNYFNYTYLRIAQEKKISITQNEENACWNTGLITEGQEAIFAVFSKNHLEGADTYWHFWKFCRQGQRELSRFASLPEMANYFEDPSVLIFDTRKELRVNVEHVVTENRDRFPEGLQNMNDYGLQNIVLGAISSAQTRVQRNYKTAIPQYYHGSIQLLLPLCLTDPGKADLALVIERFSDFYRAATCLTLDMAYNNARQLARPDRDWLAP